MTTDMEEIILLEGGLVTISQKTEGDEDEYGDPVPTWTSLSTQERVWIQNIRSARINEITRELSGNLDISSFLGFLLTSTAIVTGNILIDEDSRRFKVGKIVTVKVFGSISHKECHLSILEEGT